MLRSLILACLVFKLGYCESPLHPRGVPMSKASYYRPGESFKCIQSGKTIPFEYINDDYCDCDDGSDEPGTSACPMMRFYCENKGHKPEYILSSRVNDGICDCCDGSDEYDGEKIQCQNFCDEIGRKDREAAELARQLHEEGLKVKLTLIQHGQQLKLEKTNRMVQIEKEKLELESIKLEFEDKKSAAEAPEKEAKEKHEKAWEEEKAHRKQEKEKRKALIVFDEIDSDDNQHIELHEIQAHAEFDIDSDGTVSNEEAKEYLEELERVGADDFVEKVWPNIKEIFKSKIPEAEQKGDNENPSPEVATPPSPPTEVQGDDDDDDEYDEEDEEKPEAAETKTPEAEEEKMPDYDDETKRLIAIADEARNQFTEAEKKLRDAENEYNNLKSFLDIDFGPQDEFASLKGQCFEMTDREYTYKLCPFEKTSQRPKSGGSETSLGVWGHWSDVDGDKYAAMKYERGQNCWNGPDRSVKVLLTCGMENTLLSASEPSRCEYQFEFATPSKCSEQNHSHQDTHDEL